MKNVKLNRKGFKSGGRLDIDLLYNKPEQIPKEINDAFEQDVFEAVVAIAKKYPKLHVIDVGWDMNGTDWYDKKLLRDCYKFI